MLVKSIPEVDFTNQAAFYNKVFSLITVWLCYFLAKEFGPKVAHKMLMKLITEVNFTYIIHKVILKIVFR
jgi:hypothetical protein